MKKLAAIIIILCAVIALTPNVCANSAEPPVLTVIVYDAPYDLQIRLGLEGGGEDAPAKMKRNNSDYVFMFYRGGRYEKLIVSYGGESYEVVCSWEDYRYNNVVTLNLNSKTLTVGEPAIRTVPLVILRIALTLLIEGGIFYLFGYRKKRSWIAFVIINLITQGGLNIIFLSQNIGYMWFFAFIFTEFFVFAVEIAAFVIVLREKKPIIAAVYAFTANLASLVLGGLLIGMMQFALI